MADPLGMTLQPYTNGLTLKFFCYNHNHFLESSGGRKECVEQKYFFSLERLNDHLWSSQKIDNRDHKKNPLTLRGNKRCGANMVPSVSAVMRLPSVLATWCSRWMMARSKAAFSRGSSWTSSWAVAIWRWRSKPRSRTHVSSVTISVPQVLTHYCQDNHRRKVNLNTKLPNYRLYGSYYLQKKSRFW